MRPAARPANFLDRLFVFHPDPWIERDWARISRVPLEDVWFTSEDGTRLFGWYVASRRSRAVMLWCHGNAGNMIHRLENLAALYESGLSVFLFDYRGYGRSEGMPTEKGLYQDARAAYQYLIDVRHIEPARLVVFGRSLGAAVAGNLASEGRSGREAQPRDDAGPLAPRIALSAHRTAEIHPCAHSDDSWRPRHHRAVPFRGAGFSGCA